MPVRNEGDRLTISLDAVLRQDYPSEALEVLVIDGLSDDGSRDVVRARMGGPVGLHLLDNPGRIVSTGLNIGIRRARGRVVVRVDGHCEVARDFLRASVEVLRRSGADCAGGVLEAVGEGYWGRVIAAAMSHPFGVGTARFRTGASREINVDTVAFGAYWSEVFLRIGLFDEDLIRNQDDEFNLRLVQAGGRIVLSPTIRARYYTRRSLSKVWRQYQEYGYWKVQVARKHRRVASWRHIVPPTFVLSILGVGAAALAGVTWPAMALASSYVLAATGAALLAGPRAGWRHVPALPVVFAILHLAYGIGALSTLWRGGPTPQRDSASSHAR